MEKLTKEYLSGGVVVYGCSKKDGAFYKRMKKFFDEAGVKMVPLPTIPETDLGFETFPDLDAVPEMPDCAFVLSEKENIPTALEDVKAHGISKVLFYNKKDAADDILAVCEKNGLEARVGCPLTLYAGGTCRLHAAMSGIKR